MSDSLELDLKEPFDKDAFLSFVAYSSCAPTLFTLATSVDTNPYLYETSSTGNAGGLSLLYLFYANDLCIPITKSKPITSVNVTSTTNLPSSSSIKRPVTQTQAAPGYSALPSRVRSSRIIPSSKESVLNGLSLSQWLYMCQDWALIPTHMHRGTAIKLFLAQNKPTLLFHDFVILLAQTALLIFKHNTEFPTEKEKISAIAAFLSLAQPHVVRSRIDTLMPLAKRRATHNTDSALQPTSTSSSPLSLSTSKAFTPPAPSVSAIEALRVYAEEQRLPTHTSFEGPFVDMGLCQCRQSPNQKSHSPIPPQASPPFLPSELAIDRSGPAYTFAKTSSWSSASMFNRDAVSSSAPSMLSALPPPTLPRPATLIVTPTELARFSACMSITNTHAHTLDVRATVHGLPALTLVHSVGPLAEGMSRPMYLKFVSDFQPTYTTQEMVGHVDITVSAAASALNKTHIDVCDGRIRIRKPSQRAHVHPDCAELLVCPGVFASQLRVATAESTIRRLNAAEALPIVPYTHTFTNTDIIFETIRVPVRVRVQAIKPAAPRTLAAPLPIHPHAAALINQWKSTIRSQLYKHMDFSGGRDMQFNRELWSTTIEISTPLPSYELTMPTTHSLRPSRPQSGVAEASMAINQAVKKRLGQRYDDMAVQVVAHIDDAVLETYVPRQVKAFVAAAMGKQVSSQQQQAQTKLISKSHQYDYSTTNNNVYKHNITSDSGLSFIKSVHNQEQFTSQPPKLREGNPDTFTLKAVNPDDIKSVENVLIDEDDDDDFQVVVHGGDDSLISTVPTPSALASRWRRGSIDPGMMTTIASIQPTHTPTASSTVSNSKSAISPISAPSTTVVAPPVTVISSKIRPHSHSSSQPLLRSHHPPSLDSPASASSTVDLIKPNWPIDPTHNLIHPKDSLHRPRPFTATSTKSQELLPTADKPLQSSSRPSSGYKSTIEIRNKFEVLTKPKWNRVF